LPGHQRIRGAPAHFHTHDKMPVKFDVVATQNAANRRSSPGDDSRTPDAAAANPCVYRDLTQELVATMRASRRVVFPEQLVPTIL